MGLHFFTTENVWGLGVVCWAIAIIILISMLGDEAMGDEREQYRCTAPYKSGATKRHGYSVPKTEKHFGTANHVTAAVVGGAIAASVFDDDSMSDNSFMTDTSSSSISDTSSMDVNPATGLPMVGGMGGVDVGGDVWGSDSNSSFSDDFSTSMDSFDSFDDSFSSMSDDW